MVVTVIYDGVYYAVTAQCQNLAHGDEEEIYGSMRSTVRFDSLLLSSLNSTPFSGDDYPEPEEYGFVS